MSALTELAERCEAATKAERELDRAIAVAVGWCLHPSHRQRDDSAQSDSGYTCLDCGADSWGNTGPTGQKRGDLIPGYTASLDAAMTLVSHYGVLLHLSDIGADGLPLCNIGDSVTAQEFKGVGAANLALAVCAAALRARAATPTPDPAK